MGLIENPTAADYTTAAEFGLRTGDLALARTQIAAALTFDPLDADRLALADRILVASGDTSRAEGSHFFGDIALRARALARVGRFSQALSLLVQAVEFRDDVPYLAWTREFPSDALAAPRKPDEHDQALVASLARWLVRLPSALSPAAGTSVNLAVTAELLARWATSPGAPRAAKQGRRDEADAPARRRRQDAAMLFSVLQRRLSKLLDEQSRALLLGCFTEEPTAVVAGELGRLFQAAGSFADAARWFGEAAALEPTAPEYRLDRANAELRAGLWEEARETYVGMSEGDAGPWGQVDRAYLDARLTGDTSDEGAARADPTAAEATLLALTRNVVIDEAIRRRAGALLADARAFVRDLPLPADALTRIAFDRLRAVAMEASRAGSVAPTTSQPPRVLEVRVESDEAAPWSLRVAFARGLESLGATGHLLVAIDDAVRPPPSRFLVAADDRAVPHTTLGPASTEARAWLREIVQQGDDIPTLVRGVERATPLIDPARAVLAAALDPVAPPPSRHPLRWVLSQQLVASLALVRRAAAGDAEAARLWRELSIDPDAWLQTTAFVALEAGRAAGWSIATISEDEGEAAMGPDAHAEARPPVSAFLTTARRCLALRRADLGVAERRALRREHLDELFRGLDG
jgi:tetratricopeptide (TPR) repeat protein